MAEEAELVELGDGDLAAVATLTGVAPAAGSRWVGVRAGDRLLGVAGWDVGPAAVRLIGPVVMADERDEGLEEALVLAVEELAAESWAGSGAGVAVVEALAADETEATRLWALGYRGTAPALQRRLPEIVEVPTAEAMQELGRHLAGIVRAGDLIIASGDLGAGKTTLTQGIGEGLGVDEPVTSPTFVLSRIHPGARGRPDLVHVDAYRLADSEEVDDIDLDHDLDRSVSVIEWGAGLAEQLADDRLEIDIRRSDDPGDEGRLVILRPVGARWDGVDLTPVEGAGR